MREIQLSQGKAACVSDEDFVALNQFKWTAQKCKYTFYAYRKENGRADGTKLYMHRVILGLQKGEECDHIDGDGLNNVRENLRLATTRQNIANRRKWGIQRFKGVQPSKNKWIAQLRISGKPTHLGTFDTEEEAALAFNVAVVKEYGEFARLNQL